MNQRPRTLPEAWAELKRVEMLNKAARICDALDACDYAPGKMKQEALVLARYYINRCR